LGKYRYTVFYRVVAEGIEVVRVIHGARVKVLTKLPSNK
jgi:plasmid stabilization system protein ParE